MNSDNRPLLELFDILPATPCPLDARLATAKIREPFGGVTPDFLRTCQFLDGHDTGFHPFCGRCIGRVDGDAWWCETASVGRVGDSSRPVKATEIARATKSQTLADQRG